jgi:hypothetical protein
VVEGAVQRYEHIFVALVVTHTLDKAASGYVGAVKRLQINFAAIFYIDALRTRWQSTAHRRALSLRASMEEQAKASAAIGLRPWTFNFL